MRTLGKERKFSEDKPLKAPLAWHEIIRREKQEDKCFSSPDVFVSKFKKLGAMPVQSRFISILGRDFAGIPPGLYIETNIPPELLDNSILSSNVTLEVATLLTKQGKSKVTGELPPELAALAPNINGVQVDMDFGNAFILNVVFYADHGGTVFEIVPPLLSRAIDRTREVIEGKRDGSFILKP